MLAFGVPPKREHAMRQTRFLLVLMAGLATAPAFAAVSVAGLIVSPPIHSYCVLQYVRIATLTR